MAKQTPPRKVSALSLHGLVMPVARRFWLVMAIIALVTAASAYGLSRLVTENDLMYMMPEQNQAKIDFLDAEEDFGDSVGIVVAFGAPGGIYQGDFLRRVEDLSRQALQLNTRLLAQKLRAAVALSEDQSLMLAAWLQSLASDPSFEPADFGQMLADQDATAEGLSDFAPPFLRVDDPEELARATAEILARNAGKAAAILAVAQQTTDRRGKEKSRWVDRVVGLTQTESAWPEFVDRQPLLALLAGWGVASSPGLAALLDSALERGVSDPAALAALLADKDGLVRDGASPEAVEALAAALSPERAQALLAAMRQAPKQIRVAKMIDLDGQATPEAAQSRRLELRLKSWSFFKGALRAADDKSTLLLIQTAPNLTKESREELLVMVKQLIERDFGETDYGVYLAGESIVDHQISQYMASDIARLLPIVVAVVAIFLYFSLRGLAGVIYPLATVLLSTLWCLGFMGFVGLPVSIVGTVLPVLLVAVGSAYGIHFVHYFNMMRNNGLSREEVVRRAIDTTGLGVLIAGLTTVAGFGSLGANDIIALRDFGLAIAVGVALALLTSLYMIPALLIKFGAGKKPARPADAGNEGGGGLFIRLSGLCLRRPWWVVGFFAAVLVASGVGLSRLTVEMNNMNFFEPDAKLRQDNDFINQHLAGTVGLRAVFDTGRDNGALDPELLGVLERLTQDIPADNPEVGKVISVVDLIKKMNQAFHYNDPAHYSLPRPEDLEGARDAQALLGQYVFYVDKFGLADRRAFIDQQKRVAVLSIQVKTASSSVSSRINNYIAEKLAGPLGEALRQKGVKVRVTGIGALYKEASDLLIRGQMWSVASSMAIVLVLVALAMRSMGHGLLSILPLSVTIIFNFGLMGFLGIALDPGTAITACVAVGIGVDYSIHYLNRYRLCRQQGMDHFAAANETALGSGKAIVINAVAVAAGFLVLTFSSFVPLFNLGILIALTMILTALGSLTLVPALLTIANRKRGSGQPAAEPATKGVTA